MEMVGSVWIWLISLLLMRFSNSESDIYERRRLITFNPVADRGNSSFLSNITVFAAILKTWDCTDCSTADQHLRLRDVERFRQQVVDKLPIPVVTWPLVQSRPCPVFEGISGHSRVDRGHGMSHSQIWDEFVFFDHDTDEARFRPKPEYLTSNSYSSISGIFQAFENGTMRKNDVEYLDSDIMLIVEDGVVPVANFSIPLLQQDLERNSFDVLQLMDCPSHHHSHSHSGSSQTLKAVGNKHHSPRDVTICSGAYAITRKAAKQLSVWLDVCGMKLEHQLAVLFAEGMLAVKWSKYRHFELVSVRADDK